MAVYDLFSKRQKRLRGKLPDVYQYDDFPGQFRAQVVHIWNDVVGDVPTFREFVGAHQDSKSISYFFYECIHNILCKEYGLFSLYNKQFYNERVINFFLNSTNNDHILDTIELSFKTIDNFIRKYYRENSISSKHGDLIVNQAINELNIRFKEHGIGYQYEHGELIRVDSQLIHAEVVKPTLKFLSDKDFVGPNEEFLKAHEHYRHSRYPECLNECLKAFESTMKVICQRRKWQYNQDKDTSSCLIGICLENNLIPSFLKTHFEGGIPSIRNRLSGHGKGTQPVEIPQHLASYALHLTATTILFLVEAEKNF